MTINGQCNKIVGVPCGSAGKESACNVGDLGSEGWEGWEDPLEKGKVL